MFERLRQLVDHWRDGFDWRQVERALTPASPGSTGRSSATVWTDDELLTAVSMYWFTQSFGSSLRPYRDHPKQPELPLIEVPVAVAVQTGERGLPRSSAARAYTDIRNWTELDDGAHFTAWQVPVAVADRIEAFATSLLAR